MFHRNVIHRLEHPQITNIEGKVQHPQHGTFTNSCLSICNGSATAIGPVKVLAAAISHSVASVKGNACIW